MKISGPRSDRFLDLGFWIGGHRCADDTTILESICDRSRIVGGDRHRHLLGSSPFLCDVSNCCDSRNIRRHHRHCRRYDWCRFQTLLLHVFLASVAALCMRLERQVVNCGALRPPRSSRSDGDEGVIGSEIGRGGKKRRDMGFGCLSVWTEEELGSVVVEAEAAAAAVLVVRESLDGLACR